MAETPAGWWTVRPALFDDSAARDGLEKWGILTTVEAGFQSPTPPDVSRFSLEGKTVVLTGASKNIGAAMALGFAQAGADLLLVARGRELLTQVAHDVRKDTGRRVETVVADVSLPKTADEIVHAARQTFGTVNVLVNNAFSAGPEQVPVLDLQDTSWDEVLQTNLLAPFRLARGLAPLLTESGSGSIINVVSGSGFQPTPNMGAYGVTKAALWAMTRYLAAEAAPHIRVNALCPGITTPDGVASHEIFRQLLPLVPMGRLARPDEMVGAAVYLAGDAASYTTGEIIFVNGGRPW